MDIVSWIVLGLAVGVIATIIVKEKFQGGFFGALVLGVLGALIGGLISNIVFGARINGVSLTSLVVAIVGSLVLLIIGKGMTRHRV